MRLRTSEQDVLRGFFREALSVHVDIEELIEFVNVAEFSDPESQEENAVENSKDREDHVEQDL